MKTIKIFAAAVIATASLTLTSCEDWLTIYPQNKLTDEQFWEDMNDLQAVRFAAYRNFADTKVVTQILTWGEIRSDNVNLSSYTNAGDYSNLQRIYEGRLDTAATTNDWANFYTTINYCNQVLHNGQIMIDEKRDPQFSNQDWDNIRAEMIALRALNYFYLVRAFGNVPYVNKVIKNDSQVESHPQAYQSDILDSLINDVEAIKDKARLYFAPYEREKFGDRFAETRSLITKPFCYALLADMYMWRGAKYEGRGNVAKADEMYFKAYERAVQARELIDDPVTGQYKAMNVVDNRNLSFYGKYYLEQNFDKNSSEKPEMTVWKNMYSKGNSDDIIFGMPFNSDDNVGNGAVNGYFGLVTASSGIPFLSNYTGLKFCAPYSRAREAYYDLRLVYNCAYTDPSIFIDLQSSQGSANELTSNVNGFILKYTEPKHFTYTLLADKPSYGFDYDQSSYSNFIVYRKSDILFIEGEAICLLKKLNGAHAGNVDLTDVKWIVEEHRRRSYYKKEDFPADPVNGLSYMTETASDWSVDGALKILLDEKQLEFVGEGKRWFDIVRYMERNGGKNVAAVFGGDNPLSVGSMFKHSDHAQRYKSTLRARWAFYNPVYYPERESSSYVLYQNPYWDSDSKNNYVFEPIDRPNPDDVVEEPTPEEPEQEEENGSTEE